MGTACLPSACLPEAVPIQTPKSKQQHSKTSPVPTTILFQSAYKEKNAKSETYAQAPQQEMKKHVTIIKEASIKSNSQISDTSQTENADKTKYVNIIKCKSTVDSCIIVKELMQNMQLYQNQINGDIIKEEKLIQLCTETYVSLLDDFIHLILNHNLDQDIKYISTQLSLCNVKSCKSSHRHNRNRVKDDETKNNDEIDLEYTFYRDLLDQIHFQALHLWDHGFRTHENNEKKEIINNMDNNRLENNKFQVHSQKASETQQFSLFDFICKLLNDNNALILIKWLKSEEYDSDALQEDIDLNRNDDNISNMKQQSTDNIYNIIQENMYHMRCMLPLSCSMFIL